MVMNVVNQKRKGWPEEDCDNYVANGEIDYSFNTIPAAIQVGTSLTLKDPVLVNNN